jgi:hypothetical protein
MPLGNYLPIRINMNKYIYEPSGTDIEKRWVEKFGWVRPSSLPEYQAKYRYYQELTLRKLQEANVH